jgi:hypothetical protein
MNSPWKVTAIALALVVVTGLVTGAIVANWTGPEGLQRRAPRLEPLKAAAVRMALAPQSSAQPTPPRSTVEACNRQATAQVGAQGRSAEAVTGATIGTMLGAAVGAAGGGTLFGLDANRKHDESYRNAYARCMRSRGYSS